MASSVDGAHERYGRVETSPYEEWDNSVGDAISHWYKPFLVEGRGARICDTVEIT